MSKPIYAYFDKYKTSDAFALLEMLPYIEATDSADALVLKSSLVRPHKGGTRRSTYKISDDPTAIKFLEIQTPASSELDPWKYLAECLNSTMIGDDDRKSRAIDLLDGVCLSVKHALHPRKLDMLHLRPASRHKPMAAIVSCEGLQAEWIAEDDHPWVQYHYQPIVPETSFDKNGRSMRVWLHNVSADHCLPQNLDPVEHMRLLSNMPKAAPVTINEEDWNVIF